MGCTMPRDDQSGSARRNRRPNGQQGSSHLATSAFSLFFALFVAGGLYFGYIFVTTVASMLTGSPPPAGGPFLPANPFQPPPKGTPSAASAQTAAALPDWHGDERLNI